MEQCWSAEPIKRPLLGYVLPTLQSIRAKYTLKFNQGKHYYLEQRVMYVIILK